MTINNDLRPYLHPELSLLAFNERVLNLALNPRTPALEKLRFLCIFSSNMDEFFEIRVSGLKARAQSNLSSEGIDGLTPEIALEKIAHKAHELVDLQYQTLNDLVKPELRKHGIDFLPQDRWSKEQTKWLRKYFKHEVLPVLTPIRLDPAHPFPLTINKGLSIVVDLHDPDRDDSHNIAVVPAPRILPRLVRLPAELSDSEYEFVYLSSIIHANVDRLFRNVEVVGCHQFRITRNSDLYVDLEEVEDLARALEGELPSRLYGEAIRLEVSLNCPKRIVSFLQQRFNLSDDAVYKVDGPVNLNRLLGLPEKLNRPNIKYPYFSPSVPELLTQQADLFTNISNGDLLLHHPFQSFTPVIEFLRQAAKDPNVLAIKQTLYRTGSESVLIDQLVRAAKAGKEVTVIIELMARFDEANNLTTAQRLQDAGAHVVYGMVGKKTHAKMLLVVRKEGARLRRYVHVGTGNYHQGNTRVYTDYCLFTANREITQDVHEVFMQLTSQGPNPELLTCYQSPQGIINMLLQNINREAENAEAGKPARILAKLNGLSSPNVIDALYDASQRGVQIDLIVRGICCLRPGLQGLSDNIRVHSIVGRFLEHNRIYYFENAEAENKLFISSADWMPRNLRNRIELCIPILDEKLKDIIFNDLGLYIKDDSNSWIMQADGQYVQSIGTDGSAQTHDAQQTLLETLAESL
ncbi:MAG: polyphosphate kinase 1 [Acidiferrobacterales bacterium]|nr:polyphosphate kinase 1 [Acidiferrobacterales bacterium]